MKSIHYIISFLLLSFPWLAFAQTTVLLTADYDASIGYHDYYNTANNNYGNAYQNAAYMIPGYHPMGGVNVNRAPIHFDLSAIPPGAIVTSALMNLYAIGPPLITISHMGTNNSAYLQRITQSWTEYGVTWNNQPTTTTQNQVTLPPNTIPLQDYTNINVTQLVLDMLSANNYGFMLRLVNEALTNALVFGSINCGNPLKFPTLEITYTFMLPSPPIHCLEVLPNGNVALTWNPFDQTLIPFQSYHVWYSHSPTGPFTVFDSILNINTLTTTHTGAGANTQPVYYILTVRTASYGNPMLLPFDTVSSIYLDVISAGVGSGVVNMTWNPLRSPPLPTSSGIYEIWREHPPGNWQMIGTTPLTTASDSMIVCHEYIQYRVEIEDTLMTDPLTGPVFCRSVSSTDGDFFEEIDPPPPPSIRTVSVDSTIQLSIISWEISPAPDTEGYIIHTLNTGIYNVLDTVWGRSTTSYTDHVNNPCLGPVTYAISAFDSCGNHSTYSLEHNSILPVVTQPYCLKEHQLTWNPYIHMVPSLGGYEIYVMSDGGTPVLLATNPAGNTSISHLNLSLGSLYCYLIRAFDQNHEKLADGCVVCNMLTMPEPIDSIYIKTATVTDNQFVTIILHNDTLLPANSYQLYRSKDGSSFDPIATIPWTNQPSIAYKDHSTDVGSSSYYYRAEIIDLCGAMDATSNTVKTILLRLETRQSQSTNILYWNDYEGFSGSPTTHIVHRTTDGIPDPLPLFIAPPSTGIYIDRISPCDTCKGIFSYIIEAVEGPGNVWGLQESSQSNEVSVIIYPGIFIPSAFTPDGTIPQNAIFKPFGRFLPHDHYEFTVFNRFGQMLFTTDDYQQGWDGTFLGKPVPEGIYAWTLSMQTRQGQMFKKAGTITLIR